MAAVPGRFFPMRMIYNLKKNSTCSHGISLSRLWGDDLDDALFSNLKGWTILKRSFCFAQHQRLCAMSMCHWREALK